MVGIGFYDDLLGRQQLLTQLLVSVLNLNMLELLAAEIMVNLSLIMNPSSYKVWFNLVLPSEKSAGTGARAGASPSGTACHQGDPVNYAMHSGMRHFC